MTKKGGKLKEIVKSVYEVRERDVYLEFTKETSILQAGSYWIYAKMDWNKAVLDEHKDNMTLFLNCYGPEPVHMTYDNTIDRVKFVEQILLAKAKSIDMSQFTQVSSKAEVYRYNSKQVEDGFYFVYIMNNTEDYTYTEKMTYT